MCNYTKIHDAAESKQAKQQRHAHTEQQKKNMRKTEKFVLKLITTIKRMKKREPSKDVVKLRAYGEKKTAAMSKRRLMIMSCRNA